MEKSTLQTDNTLQKTLKALFHSMKGRLLLLCILLAGGVAPTDAQTTASQSKDSVAAVKEPFRNKIGIRTNVVDWLFTIPNIGIEMEVGKSKYYRNPYTISLVGRYNWDAWSRYKPSMVFNVADIRIEGRKYWNTIDMSRLEAQEVRDSMSYAQYLWKYAFKMNRLKPRKERGYYAGFYLGYHNYSIKFGSTGKQGMAFSGGLTAGFTIPLYSYRDRYIDLDLGGSIGLFYGKYDEYGYDAESDCYPIKAKGKSALLPWVTELRVALVYRFETVRKKTLTDKQGRIDRQNEISARKIERDKARDQRRDSLALVQKAKEQQRDSAKQARRAEKALKALQDSLKRAERDSIKLDFQLRRALQDSIENAQKDSIKLARQLKEIMQDSIKAAQKRMEEGGTVPADSAQAGEVSVPDEEENQASESPIGETMEQVAGELEGLPAQVEIVPDNHPQVPAAESGEETGTEDGEATEPPAGTETEEEEPVATTPEDGETTLPEDEETAAPEDGESEESENENE